MDFTRQPIIETIITPREGFRLVIRSSKNMGQEELFVDALEVVSFGAATLFFRSTERPKPFLVPASDYEVLEVREQRLVLKTPSNNSQENNAPRQRQQNDRQSERQNDRQSERQKERDSDRQDRSQNDRQSERQSQERQPQEPKLAPTASSEERPLGERPQEERRDAQGNRAEKGRGRDRHRRRRGDRGSPRGDASRDGAAPQEMGDAESGAQRDVAHDAAGMPVDAVEPPPLFRTILPPPQTLIRDDLQRLRDSEVYRGAFFIREEKEATGQDDDDASLQSIDADSEIRSRESKNKEAPPQGESFRAPEEYAAEVHSNPPIPLP